MENPNLIDYLYDKKVEDMLFTLKDKEFDELQKKITTADKEINKFIEQRSQLDIIIFWLHLGFHIIHNILMNYIAITNIRRFWHIFTSK